ncbi:MAG: hypothetical protein HY279_05780 [Nitrospinae bacterium]|nr:hypothetical protein [Nitrospinota bacterium]
MRTQRTEDRGQRTEDRQQTRIMSVFCLLSSVFFFIVGCSGPFKQTNLSANELYRSHVIEDINSHRIGFLTTVVSRWSNLGEYRLTVSDILEKAFKSEKPAIVFVSSREAINRINNADLTSSYSEMLDYYDITGILNMSLLKKIGNALNVRYVAQPRLLSFTETTYSRFSFLGLSLISTRETTVKIFLQVWDVSTGNIVWEGSGQATIAVEAMRAKPVTFEEAAETASFSLIKKLPF